MFRKFRWYSQKGPIIGQYFDKKAKEKKNKNKEGKEGMTESYYLPSV